MNHNQTVLGSITVFLYLLFCFYFSPSASSLTYQSSVGVNFTFNSALNVTVGGNLVINNLTPGSSSDSNVIDVSVSTNASYGYVLSATVGQKNGTSSLVNNTSSSNTFTNLNANKASLSNFTDNTWGYSYSVDDGTNWISGSTGSTASGYNGLPLDNNDNAEERGKGGITLISTDNPLDNQSIKFKIGAKASTSQPAGTYTNTINFYAVANPEPISIDQLNYLQDFGSLSSGEVADVFSSMALNTQYTLKDSRDQQDYTIAKLTDGNVWMTKNLNIAGGTTLTIADSNVSGDFTLPASSATGFSDEGRNYGDYVYNSGNTACSNTTPCYSYYSQAVAKADRFNYSYDICPKGWKLPISTVMNELKNIYTTGVTLTADPFLGVYSGYYKNSTYYNGGSKGYYWTGTFNSRESVLYDLEFDNSSATVKSSYYLGDYDNSGYAIRCIVAQ